MIGLCADLLHSKDYCVHAWVHALLLPSKTIMKFNRAACTFAGLPQMADLAMQQRRKYYNSLFNEMVRCRPHLHESIRVTD